MRNLIFLFIVVFFALPINAQINESDVNKSPYGVIYNHLYFLQNDSYDESKAARSFRIGTKDRIENSVKLKKILDGKGMWVIIDDLPRDFNFVDTLENKSVYYIDIDEKRIYVEKIKNRWYYSRTTIENIPDMYQEVHPYEILTFLNLKRKFWNNKYFGIALIQYLGFVLFFVFCFLLFVLFRFLFRKLGKLIERKFEFSEKAKLNLSRFIFCASAIIGLIFANNWFPLLELPVKINVVFLKAFEVLRIFATIFFVVSISNFILLYFSYRAERSEGKTDDQIVSIANRIVNAIIWMIGFIYLLDSIGVNTTGLIAGVSIGGIAFAFAAQDTVKNLIGTFIILIDKPFQIGDWIIIDSDEGIVEEIGIRSTRIRTFEDSLIYIPNNNLTNGVVNNIGLRKSRRFKTTLNLSYGTPIDSVEEFIKQAEELMKQNEFSRSDSVKVSLDGIENSYIKIFLSCFFDVNNWDDELDAKHHIIYGLMKIAEELNIKLSISSQLLIIDKKEE